MNSRKKCATCKNYIDATTALKVGIQSFCNEDCRKGAPRAQPKKNSFETEFAAIRPQVRLRSQGRCEARAAPNCTGRATHVHHRKLRAQGGKNTLSNLIDSCAPCHTFIHEHPGLSYVVGWLVRGSDDS